MGLVSFFPTKLHFFSDFQEKFYVFLGGVVQT